MAYTTIDDPSAYFQIATWSGDNATTQNITNDDETIKFLFDITNGCPGLSKTYYLEETLEIFDDYKTT